MQLLEKKTKCPLCGAKNEVGAQRCSICTRPLANDPLPTQAVYQEALWASKIATPGARRKTNPYLLLAVGLVVLVVVNYFVVHLGPDWAHEAGPLPKGFGWEAQTGLPYGVDMPGIPMPGTATASGTTLTTRSVWVDSNWDRIRDDETRSVAALEIARKGVHAQLVTAVGAPTPNVGSSVSSLVASLAPGAALADGGVTEGDTAAGINQYDLTTTFTGWPEQASAGTVHARVVVVGDQMYVAATFVRGGDDVALHQRLLSAFTTPTPGS